MPIFTLSVSGAVPVVTCASPGRAVPMRVWINAV